MRCATGLRYAEEALSHCIVTRPVSKNMGLCVVVVVVFFCFFLQIWQHEYNTSNLISKVIKKVTMDLGLHCITL